MSPLREWLAELGRRGVWRVAAVYAGGAFVAVEVADLFLPNLGLPPWTVRIVAIVAVAGFPVAVILAWLFERTPEGVRRTPELAGTRGRRLALVGLGASAVILATAGWWAWAGSTGSPRIERLAVLPLYNLMDDPDQEYFVQGMHDRLISELQRIGVAVIARTSVMRYASGATPVREIASDLGVDAVVEGSVFRAGSRVSIEARLVSGSTQETLWSDSFEGDLRDVAVLHRELSEAIAGKIHRALDPTTGAGSTEPAPVDPAAYEAYLRGVFHLQRVTDEDLRTALDHFERALDIDSTYAPAWVGVSKAWGWREQAGEERFARADSAVARALALDPDLPEAHLVMASGTAWRDWRWEDAERSFARAVLLDPGNAEGRLLYGHVLTILGRWEEGARQADEGLELDPLNPFMRGLHAARLILVRRRAEALDGLHDMLRANPGMGFGRDLLANVLRDEGRHEEAIETYRDVYRARGADDVVAALERGFAEEGPPGGYRRAAQALSTPERAGYESPVAVASHYLHGGDPEAALEWLERGLEQRDTNMPYIGLIPSFEPLHEHPRFRELARRVGVPILTGSLAGG